MKGIRIISPSGVIDPIYLDEAGVRLRRWGYEVTEGRYARAKNGRFAGTDEEWLEDLEAALADDTVDAILCSRGGYGMQRLALRLGSLRANKPIIGFSDITVLHQWSALQGQPSLHGLMCKHLATLSEDSEPVQYWRQALEDEPLEYTLPAHKLNREGKVMSIMIGGNLSVLYGLQGTPLSLKAVIDTMQQHGIPPILFIEDIAERHYHIERMLLNLKMSGVLASLAGVVVGQFSDCEDDASMGETVYETIARILAPYPYPVLMNFPAGHVDRNLPLWFGTPLTLTVTDQQASIRYVRY